MIITTFGSTIFHRKSKQKDEDYQFKLNGNIEADIVIV